MALMQNALKAQDSLNAIASGVARAREGLDNILRQLIEEQDDPGTEPPSLGAYSSTTPRPSERPTLYHDALKNDVFMNLCRKRFQESRTDEQREAVRELVRKGKSSKVLNDEEVAILEKEFG